MMPEMDGYEVARHLRSDERTADTPIIMFTAKSQVDDKVRGFEAGADDYLTKPTQPRELFAHLKAVLARSGKGKKVSEAPPREKGYQIGLVSVKGGLGVTTLALNLGIAIHLDQDKDVIVADFRPGHGTIGLELGYLKNEGLTRLLAKPAAEITSRQVEAEMIVHASGIRLLLSSHNPMDAQYQHLAEHFYRIDQILLGLGRYVILDLGSGLTISNQKILPLCDHIIVVVEPVPHSITQTKILLEELSQVGAGEGRVSVVLVNRIRSGVQLSWSQVQEQLGQNIAVIFTPAPELAYQASVHSVPITIQQPESLTAQQFQKLADRVTAIKPRS